MKLPPAYELVQEVILGLLSAGAVLGVGWLVLGETPSLTVCMIGAPALRLAGVVAARIHRNRERRRLQDAFDRPAFGEDHH